MQGVFPYLTVPDARHVRLTCRAWYQDTQRYRWTFARLTAVRAHIASPLPFPESVVSHGEDLLIANCYTRDIHVGGSTWTLLPTGLDTGIVGLALLGANVVAMTYGWVHVLEGPRDATILFAWPFEDQGHWPAVTVVRDSLVIVQDTTLMHFTPDGTLVHSFPTHTRARCMSVTTVGEHVAVVDWKTPAIQVIALTGALCYSVPIHVSPRPFVDLCYWPDTDEWVLAQTNQDLIRVGSRILTPFFYPQGVTVGQYHGQRGVWVCDRNHDRLCFIGPLAN